MGRGVRGRRGLAGHWLGAHVTAIRANGDRADFLRLVRCSRRRSGTLCWCDRRRQGGARRSLVCEILQRDRLLLGRNDLFLVSTRQAVLTPLPDRGSVAGTIFVG